MKNTLFRYFLHLQLLLGALAGSQHAAAQVSLVVRPAQAYTQALFPYAGERLLMADNAMTPSDNSVFIFSKPATGTQPDVLYFQRYQKKNEQWVRNAYASIEHSGLISVWNSRKGFVDPDKDQQIDAYFVYSKHELDKTQTSVHLLVSHKAELYTLSAHARDHYKETLFSPNFSQLPSSIKEAALNYWDKLDKE